VSAAWPDRAHGGKHGAVQCRACASNKNKRLQIDPILISILLATGLAGLVSITAAAVFSFTLLSKVVERMVSLSVGIMLSTSLLNAGFSRARAYVFNLMCSMLAVGGGLLGYYTLDKASGLIPYVLVFASSGFIYIAVSDLMPQMQRRATVRESVPQVLLIGLGVVIVLLLTHGH
jgi:zinc transporter ZupT